MAEAASHGAGPVRRFVVIGQTASASGGFSTEDLPSSSGRIDVLLRCVRAALMVSHGVRHDAVVYLVLRGGERAPRVLRFVGREARFLRPDERSLAILVKKALNVDVPRGVASFVEVKPGIAIADGDLDCVLSDAPGSTPYYLVEEGDDLREQALDADDSLFVLGDHLGLDDATSARLAALPCRRLSVGPVTLHTDDVVTLVQNELDRRRAR